MTEVEPLAVYVHWPFCRAKCPYCDFNSHVRAAIDEARFRAALLAELNREAARLPGRTVGSLFFGGGTPSLMAPETVAAVIEAVRAHWQCADDLEITLEANPTSVEAARFAAFRAAGVNRVSLGVQALNDDALRFLGRQHNAREALGALEVARTHFERFNFDLIYARPEQTRAAWQAELKEALALARGHLSLYQLTIEKGTPFFAAHEAGSFALPTEPLAAALFELTQRLCEAAGLIAYEVSNHAAPGAESRHNLAYWRYQDYLGIGPGAHGRLTLPASDGGPAHGLATRRHAKPETWLEAVERAGQGSAEEAVLEPETRAEEMLMMGLRLREGVAVKRFQARTGLALDAVIDHEARAGLLEAGLLTDDGEHLAASAQGRLVLNALIARLLA